jgi:hypothetical protein
MKEFLKKKIYKTIPLWSVIALLMTSGVAYGAFTWISNIQTRSVDVSLWEIELNAPDGIFTGLHPGEQATTTWPYVVNDVQNSEGFIIITFVVNNGVTVLADDVSVGSVNIEGAPEFNLITGYPIAIGRNIEFAYGLDDTTGYDFSTNTEPIWISWTANSPEISIMSVRISSVLE